MPSHFQIAMKSLAKKYKERVFRDGIWRYLSVDDFIKDVIRDALVLDLGPNNTINLPDCELYRAFRNFSNVATRHHRRNKIKDNELTFEDFFCKDLVEEWNFNFSHQSERTYNILKFLDVLHPKKDLSFSAEYDESEDDFILVNVKALS
jgi:ribosomal protein S18 acetylase RimI-like enzyme